MGVKANKPREMVPLKRMYTRTVTAGDAERLGIS
jgi:hypothetical protein